MRVGFYAPLKPPDHPEPSGDRRMARLLISALRGMGHDVAVISGLRSYNKSGDAGQEAATAAAAQFDLQRIERAWAAEPAGRPDLLFTYHVYHKAADYLGPALKSRFGLPYVIAEASVAPKRKNGPWAAGYAQAAAAIQAADAILAITTLDRACLTAFVGEEKVLPFPPFIDPLPFLQAAARREDERRLLAERFHLPLCQPWLLAVGMMRGGDKLASYRRLAETLQLARQASWHMLIAGDGPEETAVLAAFGPLGGRTRFLGQLELDDLAGLYAASDLYVWPAVNEAYGMALLEAQAAGLPVLSVNTRGVPDIVCHRETGWLADDDSAIALSDALLRLLNAPAERQAMAAAAPRRVERHLSIAAAQQRLATLFQQLGLAA
ncbi:MAG TPA: glycosyltransferase family 4 protein [Ferrovibrio sp.]|uniref:glycosyltransferase family 4 protein n=1 Tax=Ferrovibrio sp. TaxID=1917215 RepID=UPI002ED23D59